MAGISARQGGHQLAQMLMISGFPRRSERVNLEPSELLSVKSGAENPFRGAEISILEELPEGALENQIHAPLITRMITEMITQ